MSRLNGEEEFQVGRKEGFKYFNPKLNQIGISLPCGYHASCYRGNQEERKKKPKKTAVTPGPGSRVNIMSQCCHVAILAPDVAIHIALYNKQARHLHWSCLGHYTDGAVSPVGIILGKNTYLPRLHYLFSLVMWYQ